MAKTLGDPLKKELRNLMKSKLEAMTTDDRSAQSTAVLDKILNHPRYQSASRISLFLSLPSEVDTQPILEDSLARQKEAFVPQYSSGVMRMLRVLPGDVDAMPETSWGIKQHAKSVLREDALDNGGLDLVIAPGVAFTRSGLRLGHGGGYYDRYLSGLYEKHRFLNHFRRPYVMAVAYTQQLVDDVPCAGHDVQVDEVVTAD